MGRILKAMAGRAPNAPESAGDILAEARRQADAVLSEARAEAERLEAAAREEGERARERRAADGDRDRARIRAELEVQWRLEGEEERERETISLALAVAEKVLAVAVEDPRAARETARRALRRAEGLGATVLRCHPRDEAGLREALAELRPAGAGTGLPELRPDPAVGPGGAIVDTEAGTIDARIEQQLRLVARCLEAGA